MSLLWLLGACDPKPEPDASPDIAEAIKQQEPAGKTAEAFDLAAIPELIKTSQLEGAKQLEEKINDPSAGINKLDLDEDGVTDLVEVIESRDNNKATLTLRAIPSTKLGDDPKTRKKIAEEHGVVIGHVEFLLNPQTKTISIDASFTPHIHHEPEEHVYHHEISVIIEGDELHVAKGHLFFYLFVFEHEFYLGHYHHHHIDIHVHHKHKKHKHHKHKKHKKHKKFKHHKFKH